jgi:hypothetical protein
MHELRLYPHFADPVHERDELARDSRLRLLAGLWLCTLCACGAVDAAAFSTAPAAPTRPPLPGNPTSAVSADEAPPSTNPFVLVQHDPASTFGTDADTASYQAS